MKVQVAILSLAALAFAGPALAQHKESGIYIGGAIGQAEQSDQCSNPGPGVSCDNKDGAWKIFGGFQFNRHVAVELGYANLGEATASLGATSATDEATAFEVVALGMLPIGDRFAIFAKAGFFRGELERTSNNPLVATGTNEQTDFTFGLGVRFDITHNIGLRAEWQRYIDLGEITDVDLISLGVQFKF
jgi:OmpA-OmpF porin, OOP family